MYFYFGTSGNNEEASPRHRMRKRERSARVGTFLGCVLTHVAMHIRVHFPGSVQSNACLGLLNAELAWSSISLKLYLKPAASHNLLKNVTCHHDFSVCFPLFLSTFDI